MKSKLLAITGALFAAVLSCFIWVALRAHSNLVTLNVRDMDVRQVVSKIEWQTWERIFVDTNVQGKVTLNVQKVPLEEVLRIIGDQTFCRWSVIYPLYSTGNSLAWLKKSLHGEANPAEHGWTNLNRGGFRGGPMFGAGPMMMGGFGPMGGMPPFSEAPRSQLISLEIQDKDLSFAAIAFERFAQTRVVPEDGTTARVRLNVKRATTSEAVSKLARSVRRSWTRLYLLRGDFGPRGPGGPLGPQFASRDPNNNPGGFGGLRPPGQDLTPEQRDELRKGREALEEELKLTLPADERLKLEQARAERDQQMKDMQNMTPEQRRDRFGQMGAGMMDRRNLDRLKNSTPEQRVEQNRFRSQMRQRGPQGPNQAPPR
jgi:hypothetical protein